MSDNRKNITSKNKRLSPTITIINAGTHPEPMQIAQALDDAGRKVAYLTASYLGREKRLNLLLKILKVCSPIRKQVERRRNPLSLEHGETITVALWAEIVFQISLRLIPKRSRLVLAWRTRFFTGKCSKYISRIQPKSILIAQSTSAFECFAASPEDAVRMLNYPIAHHHWMICRLQSEAESNPAWASHLQGHDRSMQEINRMDREIDLATLILVPSSFVKRTFIEQGVPANKIEVISLGADPDLFSRTDVLNPVITPTVGLKLLFVGQVNQRKGIGYLLEVMSLDENRDHTLTVVGKASPEMAAIIRSSPNVMLYPTMAKAELGPVYRSADALILPSLAEGFPLVAIEAMSVGTPCLISHETFAADVISDGVNGILIESGSKSSINEAVQLIASDPDLLSKMSIEAKQSARKFTWDNYRQEALRVIDKHCAKVQ